MRRYSPIKKNKVSVSLTNRCSYSASYFPRTFYSNKQTRVFFSCIRLQSLRKDIRGYQFAFYNPFTIFQFIGHRFCIYPLILIEYIKHVNRKPKQEGTMSFILARYRSLKKTNFVWKKIFTMCITKYSDSFTLINSYEFKL